MKHPLVFCLLVGTLLLPAGCGESSSRTRSRNDEPLPPPPPHMQGTVAHYARLVDAGYLPVEGYGLVVGLGKNGSSEVPAHIERYLIKELSRFFGRHSQYTEAVSPRRVLMDADTAVVRVRGVLPPGAPAGKVIDVHVEALPNTQTTSLDGGTLWPTELFLSVPGVDPARHSVRQWATASGSIFCNPYLDANNPADQPRLREGKVIGGGRIIKDRQIKIQLLQPDYARADLIQSRINMRFSRTARSFRGEGAVANAKSPSAIDIRIPPEYQDDYQHFLELVMHLPVRRDNEVHARLIAEQILLPDAPHDQLALVWEAIGKPALPAVAPLCGSDNPHVAFHAARTAVRLGDRELAPATLVHIAQTPGAPHRVEAIEELGRQAKLHAGFRLLRELLDDPSEQVRAAAYEGLLRHGDYATIRRLQVGDAFDLDLVESNRDYVIYASQSHRPRIALFGTGARISKPMFYNAPDDLVTVDAPVDCEGMKVFRKVSVNDSYSDTFEIGCELSELIRTLGETPEHDDTTGEIKGLGLTYGQVVRVLNDMCHRGDIRATFVLQKPPTIEPGESGHRPSRPDVR